MVVIEVYSTHEDRPLCYIKFEHTNAKIEDVKRQVALKRKVPMESIAISLNRYGERLSEDLPLSLLGQCVSKIYVVDLREEISLKNAFLLQYSGALFIYVFIFFGYGYMFDDASPTRSKPVLPFMMWCLHFTKRILETLYVHRLSLNGEHIYTFWRNCGYYWGFAAVIAYHINHPFYTLPCEFYRLMGSILFIICEMGNFSVHWLLRSLRQPGTNQRKIPYPDNNIFTYLFTYVSCPNYTYEVGCWLGFTFVANCFYANLFMLIGFVQMTVWATAKHHRYNKQFEDYPKDRKILIPFLV